MQKIATMIGAVLVATLLAVVPTATAEAQVDRTPPIIEFVEQTPGQDELVATGVVPLAFRVTDETEVRTVRVRLLGSTLEEITPDADGTFRMAPDLATGRYRLHVVGLDSARNKAAAARWFTVVPGGTDNQAPDVNLFVRVNSDDRLRFRVVMSDQVLSRGFYFIQNVDTGQYVQNKRQPGFSGGNRYRFGETLVDGFTRLGGPTGPDLRFTQWITLPPGNYRAVAFAHDHAGNTSDKVIKRFVIPG